MSKMLGRGAIEGELSVASGNFDTCFLESK